MTDAPLTLLISRTLRRIVVRRKLSTQQVAQRAGINPRTAERFLDGVTFEPRTANAISRGLGVSLPLLEEERASLLGGLPLWRLVADAELWARQPDLPALLLTTGRAVRLRVEGGLQRQQIEARHVRRGVTDVDIEGRPASLTLTRSPTGCTMVALPAVLWLLLTSQGEAGERARAQLVEVEARRARREGEFR